jgi:hypothetical protein
MQDPIHLVRPAVPCSSFLQYPQYPSPTVPALPTVPCSTHGYCHSTQLPLLPRAVPTVPKGTAAGPNCHFYAVQYPQYPQYPAVPNCHFHPVQYPEYPQYPAVTTGTVQYPNTSTVPAVPCSTHLQYPQYRDCRSTHGYCAVPARVTNDLQDYVLYTRTWYT